MRFSSFLALLPLAGLALAGPAPFVRKREVDLPGNLAAIIQGVAAAVSQGDPTGVTTALRNVVRIADAPTSPEQVAATLQAILQGANPPATLYEYIANLEALNLIDTIDTLIAFINNAAAGQDSPNNNNPAPPDVIYPQKLSCDQPYSVDETTLRSAIYIPPSFTYGTIPPVILFPGTGNYGYETFEGNFIPLLTGSDFADPVWVNVPGRLLNDAQKNAEFAAYAINYIRSVTQKNVTMLAWSQGNIDSQWAYKYWPSTTTVVSDHVAISADYDGTVVANFAALPGEPLPPSLLQQQYLASSNFITTLQTCNGDSGYVPTTSIYSGFLDEIVEPQQGTAASAFLNDVRGVGVTNYQVQLVCAGQPAGTFYTHEGVLYNPLSYYLLRDAMTHAGPGDVSRLSLTTVCATYLTPGLTLGDLLVTENTVAIAGLAILTYPTPVFAEPAISAYALTCPVSTCLSTTTTTTTSTMSSTSTTLTTTTTTTSVTSTSSGTASTTSTTSGTASTTSTSKPASTTSTSSNGASTTMSSSTVTTSTASSTKSGFITTSTSLISSGSTTSADYSTSSKYSTSSDYTTSTTTASDKYATSSTNSWADWESWTSTTTTTDKHDKSTGTVSWESWSPESTSDTSYNHEHSDPSEIETWASWSSTTARGDHPYKPAYSTDSKTWESWSSTKAIDGQNSKPKATNMPEVGSSQTWNNWADVSSSMSPRPAPTAATETTWATWENVAAASSGKSSVATDNAAQWSTWSTAIAAASASKTSVLAASATAQGTWASWSAQASATPSAIVGTWKGDAGHVRPGLVMALVAGIGMLAVL